MSLYSAPLCLGILGVDHKEIARFRDAWFSDDGKRIIILTRTGGGNRTEYAGSNARLTHLPDYLSTSDDNFDSTFARFEYLVPEEIQKYTAMLAQALVLAGNGEGKQGTDLTSLLSDVETKKQQKLVEENKAEIMRLASEGSDKIIEWVLANRITEDSNI